MNEHLIITPKTTESYTLVKKKMAEKGAFWLNHSRTLNKLLNGGEYEKLPSRERRDLREPNKNRLYRLHATDGEILIVFERLDLVCAHDDYTHRFSESY